MVDIVTIEDLPPEASPSRSHILAAMKAGLPSSISLGQIIDLFDVVAALLPHVTADNTIDDTDLLLYLTGSDFKKGTLAGLVSSLFKSARTISDAKFASLSFGLKNAAGYEQTHNITALTAARQVVWPNAGVDIGKLQNVGKFAVLQDQKAATNQGGAAVVGWQTRALGTEVSDADNIVVPSSNTFTTTIDCDAWFQCPAYACGAAAARLWNVTDGVEVGRSPSAYTAANAATVTMIGRGKVVAGKVYRVEMYASTARATDGLGPGLSAGVTEIYTTVYLQGLAA
jgi:hypothetical protein